ncbi:MAG: (Fe-S)-binding protein [Terriglobales bacterium]
MIRIEDIARRGVQLADPARERLIPLPPPYDAVDALPPRKRLSEQAVANCDCSLDGFLAVGMPRPKTEAEERQLTERFLSGLEKLLSSEDNWAFLQQLTLSLDHCARCQTCVESCPVYTASGHDEVYRPTFRSEVFRRIVKKYGTRKGRMLAKLKGEDVELNATTIVRLLELAYRCTLCRRCTQSCPMGVDNALLTREIRKLFSMELGIAPREIHEKGSVVQLRTGSSTGMNARAVKDNIEFLDEEIREQTGLDIHTPWDQPGADILLIHNAGEILSWPENPMAFAIILEAAGLSWTMSSEIAGYDSVNYGLWYDDAQFARVAIRQMEAARKLGVKKIVVGECGHGHKALMVTSDRLLPKDLDIPRESALTLLRDIVKSGRLKLDPARNDFPVTLHDPCNMVRMMGIVKPQRDILNAICPQFREMAPHGVENYCCGGGSGFALMSSYNFEDWRLSIAGRMKMKQILEAFADCPEPETRKYVCAPCSNCKGQFRDLFNYYGVWDKSGILYGGLAELIVNAMTELKEPFIKWEAH